MIKKMKIDKNLLLTIGLTSLVFFLMMLPYWINNLPLEYGGDLKPQYFATYQEFSDLVKSFVKGEGLPFYSWEMFLGNNFWASKSFHFFGDIYDYIGLLMNTHFYNVFAFQTFLKLNVSAISFYYFAKYLGYSPKVRVILSLLFSMSSWVFFFIGQPMFISFLSFTPLFFLGFEIYLKERKMSLFILATSLLLFTNYYLFFSLSVFAPFYFLARYYIVNKSFKNVFKSTGIIIFGYFVGVLVTMLLTLPTFIFILQNDRVGTIYYAWWWDQIEIIFHMIQSLFYPSQQLIYKSYNVFETGAHYSRELCLWAGSITAILVPQIFTDKDKYFRNSMIVLYIVMILFMIVPTFSMVMQGFSNPSFRWLFLMIFVNLMVCGRYLNDFNLINIKNLKITTIIMVILAPLNFVIYLMYSNKLNIFMENVEAFYIGILSSVMLLLMYFIIRKNSKLALTLILLVTFSEVAFYNAKLIGFDRRNDNSTWEFVERATSVLQSYPGELNAHLDSFDENNFSSLYRVFVPHESLYWTYSHNQNLHYDLMGTMTYDSTYTPSFNDMKMIAPQVKAFGSEWIFDILDPNILDFVNVKYAIVSNPEELPHENFSLVQSDYRGSLMIYENLNYRPIGTTYSKIITYDEYLSQGYSTDSLNNFIISHESDVEEISQFIQEDYYQLENIDFHNNYFYGNVNAENGGFMVLGIPFDEGWDIKVNGESIDYFKVNGGMIGLPLQDGFNEITMYYTSPGFKEGVVLTAIGISLMIAIFLVERKKR